MVQKKQGSKIVEMNNNSIKQKTACFNDSLLTSKRSEQKGYEACVH